MNKAGAPAAADDAGDTILRAAPAEPLTKAAQATTSVTRMMAPRLWIFLWGGGYAALPKVGFGPVAPLPQSLNVS